MNDGMLGIVPHKTSNKDFLKKGIVPTQQFRAEEDQNSITWVLISAIALTMTMITSLVIHPELIKCGLEVWVVVLIDALIGAAVMLVLIFVVSPELNKAFAEETTVKDVDPNSTPSGNSESSKVAIFAAAMAGVGYMARRNSKPVKSTKAQRKTKKIEIEPSHEELLSKINALVKSEALTTRLE